MVGYPMDETPDSGNVSSCYMCDRDLTRLDEKLIDRRYETYVLEDNFSKDVLLDKRTYVMSLCIWCGSMYPCK
jgi:hypothetical protein